MQGYSKYAWKTKISAEWAGAVSAATVLTQRTGDVRMEDVERIKPNPDLFLKAAEKLGLQFKLIINEQQLI